MHFNKSYRWLGKESSILPLADVCLYVLRAFSPLLTTYMFHCKHVLWIREDLKTGSGALQNCLSSKQKQHKEPQISAAVYHLTQQECWPCSHTFGSLWLVIWYYWVVWSFEACQELYVPPVLTSTNSTWWLHSVYVFSEQTAIFALHNINSLVFKTEVQSVYSAVRTESVYNPDNFRL